LILGAGGDILFGQMSQKSFQLLFAQQMKGKPFELVAISAGPGAVTACCAQRKMLAPNDIGKPLRCVCRLHSPTVIHEQAVVD